MASETLGGELPLAKAGDPRRIVFGAAILAIFMASIEATIVSTAMPTIVGDLGGLKLFAWVFGLFFFTQAVTIPIYGRLSDIYGRKRLLFIAIAVFLVSSIACGFATSMTALIVFRAVQGLGAGGIQPVATTIVGDIYTAAERARYQGYLSSTWGISAVVGPLLGAFLLARYHWSAIFWINVPIGVLCVTAFSLFYHERVEPRKRTIDYLGTLLLSLAIGALMLILLGGVALGLVPCLGIGALGAASLAWLLVHELRTPEPILPVQLWGHKIIAIANAGCFMIGAAVMGISVFLPTYIQGAMGQTPLVAGLAVGMQSLFWTFGSISGGQLMLRTSYRVSAAAGSCVLLTGAVLFILLEPWRGPWFADVASAAMGLGFGMTNVSFLISTQSAVGREARGAATASNLFMRNLGQTIGTAVLGAVFNAALSARGANAGTVVQQLIAARAHPSERLALAGSAQAVAAAVHDVYLIGGGLALALLALTLTLPPGLNPTRPGAPWTPRKTAGTSS